MKSIIALCLIFSTGLYADPWPLGTVDLITDKACSGGRCYQVRVDCPDVAKPGYARLRTGGHDNRGTILFFSGGSGKALWANKSTYARNAVSRLRRDGFQTVEVAWGNGGWLSGSEGQAKLACRPATIADWMRNKWPTNAFCATGNSGGASQVAFMLTHYGIPLDLAVLTGGPVMSRIDAGCLLDDEPYTYTHSNRRIIDRGYAENLCSAQNFNAESILRNASHNIGGTYVYPDTLIWQMFGEFDTGTAFVQGMLFHDRIADSPHVALSVIPGATHDTHKSLSGAKAIYFVLRDSCQN